MDGRRLQRENRGGDWVQKTFGWDVEIVSKPRKPAPEEVLMAWAREWAKEGVALDWQQFMPPQGFASSYHVGGSWSGRFLGSTRTGG